MSSPIFCCGSARPFEFPKPTFFDPERHHNNAIFTSFLAYAIRNGTLFQQPATENSITRSTQDQLLTPEALEPTPPASPEGTKASKTTAAAAPFVFSNPNSTPFTTQTPSIIHLETRNDFGPVISHRYFVASLRDQGDWAEATQMQYWQASGSFVHVAAKKAYKCPRHDKFFKVELKPNISLRKKIEPPEAFGGIAEGQI